MIDILNQEVQSKTGDIFTVIETNEKVVKLSSNKSFDYIKMFTISGFKMVDEYLNDKVIKDINEIIEIEKLKIEYDRLVRIMNGSAGSRNISSDYDDLYRSGEFQYYKIYGSKALTIYQNGVNCLGFKRDKQGYFNLQQILYSTDCTIEGYSVWMLPYSSVTGNSNGSWLNVIENDKITVYNIFDNPIFNENERRLTFVKQKDGEYVFLGVYRPVEYIPHPFAKINKNCKLKEVYVLESKNYPY